MAKNELIVATGFNYSIVDKDKQEKLRYCAKEIAKHKTIAAGSMMAFGEMLTIAHEQLSESRSGEFQRFVELECGFSLRSAYNYMAAYSVFGDFATVAKLEDGAMYALASKEAPEKARKEALRLAESGTKITQKQAKALIKKYKPSTSPSKSTPSAPSAPTAPAKPEPTKEEQLKLELKKVRSYAEYLQRSIDDLNGLKRNTVMHPQLIKACAQILEGLKRW